MEENGFSIALTDSAEIKILKAIMLGLAALSISISQVNVLWKIGLFVGLYVVSCRIWQGYWLWLTQPNKVYALRYETQVWWLMDKDKTAYPATLENAFVSRWLVIMNFHSDPLGKRSVIFSKSATDKNHFRQLRRLLRGHYRP